MAKQQQTTPFQRVAEMNEAFGNPKGDPNNIDWGRVRNQVKNIGDEYVETIVALGINPAVAAQVKTFLRENVQSEAFTRAVNVVGVRDGLADIQVFKDGALHMMGYDGDRDMNDVVDGVMTRFIKDSDDLLATRQMHERNGVTEVYFEGEFPTMVMKSAVDQPDAPKGKFLKSASYKDTVFRPAP